MGDVLPDETHTVVLGAGTGGASVAGLLAEHGTEPVLVLEAGPDYGPLAAGRWPSELLDARVVPLSHDWGLGSADTVAGRVIDYPRARVVGGCSAHNGCTAAVGAHADYDGWAAAGNPGWATADLEPLIELVRERFRVRCLDDDELTPIQGAFVAAGQACGLPYARDLDQLRAGVGIGPMAVNIVDGVRFNAAFAFLDPVRDQPTLSIRGGVQVDRVEISQGRATGVRVKVAGERRLVRAERVVICAGAYGTPAILLRSGIGPAGDLAALGLEIHADLPGVGANLLDHPCVQLNYAGSAAFHAAVRASEWHPDEQTVGRARSSHCDEGPYDIHVFMVAGANSGHPGLPPISLYGGVMRARSQGRVTLLSTDPAVAPRIDHRYLSDPEDHDAAVAGEALALLEQMVADDGLAALLGDRISPPQVALAANVVNYCHPVGTARMGPASDPEGVVDNDGNVHGIEGLFVADASIMPTITRANVNLPTAVAAARVACGLLGLEPRAVAGAVGRAPA